MPKKAVEKPTEAKKGFHKWSKFDGSRFDGKFADANENPLAIDQDLIAGLNREGLDLRWVRTHCIGQPDDKNVTRALRNGWVPVEKGDIPEILTVEEGGLQLMARPMAISKKARALEAAEAKAPVLTKEMQIKGGDLLAERGVMGADHPSARAYNKMRKTVERITVPDSEA
jgi:hypothetical protein